MPLPAAALVLLMAGLALLAAAPSAAAATEPWTPDLRLTDDDLGSFSPAAAVDARDVLRVVWVNAEVAIYEDPGKIIAVTTYQDGQLAVLSLDNHGTPLHPPVNITNISDPSGDGYMVDAPQVAVDTRGQLHVVWSDDHTGVFTVYYLALDKDDQLLRMTSVSNSRDTTTGEPTQARFPDVAVDDLGNAHIVWADWREGEYPEVFYSRIDQDGDVAKDNEKVTHSVFFQAANHPALTVDPEGDIHVVWEQNVGFVPGTDDELFYTVMARDGTVTTDSVRLTNKAGFQGRPDLAVGTDGIPRLVWEDDAGDGVNIRFRTLAAATEDNNGVKVTTCTKECIDPRVAMDGAGVATIVWSERASPLTANAHAFATQLHPDGTFVATLHGRLLDRTALVAEHPAVVVDSYGNPIAIWADQRVTESGAAPVWDLHYSRTVAGDGVNRPPAPALIADPASPLERAEVLLDGGSSIDPDGWDTVVEFRFDFGDGNVTDWLWTSNVSWQYPRAGTYPVRLEVRDRFGLTSNVTLPLTVREGPGGGSNVVVPGGIAPWALAVVLGGVLGGLASTQAGKFWIFSTLLVPLYSRIRRENTLDNYVRGQIHGFVMARPGCHYNHIKQTLNLNNGTLAYHLRKLEKEEFIKSQRDGMYKRFYAVGSRIPAGRVVQLTDMQKRVLLLIQGQPGISQKEVAGEAGISAPAVIYHIGILVGANRVRREKDGGKVRYFPVPESEWDAPFPAPMPAPTSNW